MNRRYAPTFASHGVIIGTLMNSLAVVAAGGLGGPLIPPFFPLRD
jgi:hypothetical protein